MPALPFIHSPRLLLAGVLLIGIGWLLRRWAGRHDLVGLATGAATTAAWQSVKGRKAPELPETVKSKIQGFQAESSHVGKAKMAAGYVARHAVAKVAGLSGLAALLIGAAMVAAAVLWT